MTKDLTHYIVSKSEDGGYLFTSEGIETLTEEQKQEAIKQYDSK